MTINKNHIHCQHTDKMCKWFQCFETFIVLVWRVYTSCQKYGLTHCRNCSTTIKLFHQILYRFDLFYYIFYGTRSIPACGDAEKCDQAQTQWDDQTHFDAKSMMSLPLDPNPNVSFFNTEFVNDLATFLLLFVLFLQKHKSNNHVVIARSLSCARQTLGLFGYYKFCCFFATNIM